MLVTTTLEIPGYRIIKVLGIAKGSTIRSKHIGHSILASIRSLFGGEITDYTKLLAECRDESLARMIQDGKSMGANAIINVRFSTSNIMENAAELLAYGTAVLVESVKG